MGEVDVVVGNYEGASVLPDLFASLEVQTLRPSRVIVVDAGSRDESVAIASAAGATVISVRRFILVMLYSPGPTR